MQLEKRHLKPIPVLLILCSLLVLVPGSRCKAGEGLFGLGPCDSLLVTGPDGRVLFSVKPDVPRIPASVIKLLTASAAFHYLTPDYRFRTRYRLDDRQRLWVTGYGDPLYISEVIAAHAETLARGVRDTTGSDALAGVCLDDAAIPQPVRIPGVLSGSLQPYDAPNGALCANFNTVVFKTAADGSLVTAEAQTPLVDWVKPWIRATGQTGGRIHLSPEQDAFRYYPGHLLAAFLAEAGISVSGPVRLATWSRDQTAVRTWEFSSPWTLHEGVRRLMQYSNNFIANQLILTLGREQPDAKQPADTMAAGRNQLNRYAQDILKLETARLVEGSGISRENQISCADMDRVLIAFLPYRDLLVRKRNLSYKTGTLSGISARAGYIDVPDRGGPVRFVIFCNTRGSDAQAVMIKVAAAVCSGVIKQTKEHLGKAAGVG
ncbi:MAG: hypothetical protein CSA22_00720 [Deltaproteobacteria bacterium]|nr:MAG: hypothetical protein CSA22_00720 [Deltaproteobacteria bacterium]